MQRVPTLRNVDFDRLDQRAEAQERKKRDRSDDGHALVERRSGKWGTSQTMGIRCWGEKERNERDRSNEGMRCWKAKLGPGK